MVPEILKLCRVYYSNENFRNSLENWFNKSSSNLQDNLEGLFIDDVTMYVDGTDRLSDGSEPSAVVGIEYHIRRKGVKFPVYGHVKLNVHEENKL
jgi:hypothetical protein